MCLAQPWKKRLNMGILYFFLFLCHSASRSPPPPLPRLFSAHFTVSIISPSSISRQTILTSCVPEKVIRKIASLTFFARPTEWSGRAKDGRGSRAGWWPI